jgi:multiple sugar transport system substrate-binding protein/putative aldouronate transport system substrate-binding protein
MYTVNADGKYELTEDGLNRFTADVQIPEEYGGGTFTDGNNNINQWIVAGIETNPETGETYSSDYWASYLELNSTATNAEWSERFGAKDEVDYLKTNDKADFVPWINMSLPSDDTDVALARSQCGKEICDASWRMVWATSEEEFDQMWDEMVTTLNGLGWESVVAFDTEKYQAVVDARIAAMK